MFRKTFNLSKSKILFSPESGSEEIRRLNKGYYFSNKELLETINYSTNLGIYTEIYFLLGLPFATPNTLKATKNFQEFLKQEFGKKICIYTDFLALEPGSPMDITPAKYRIVKTWNSFMDFYYGHGRKNNSCKSISSYYLQDFCAKKHLIGLTEAKIFRREFEKIRCRDFCRLANFVLINLKKRGLKFPVRLVSILSNLLCNLMSYFWKYKCWRNRKIHKLV